MIRAPVTREGFEFLQASPVRSACVECPQLLLARQQHIFVSFSAKDVCPLEHSSCWHHPTIRPRHHAMRFERRFPTVPKDLVPGSGREVEVGGAKHDNLPLLCLLCAAEVRPLVGPSPMNKRRISLNIQKYPQCVLLSIAFVHIFLFLGICPPSSTRLRAGSPPRWLDLESSHGGLHETCRIFTSSSSTRRSLEVSVLTPPGSRLKCLWC